MTRRGFEVVAGFLPTEECARLVSLAESLIRETSYTVEGDCYFVRRADAHDTDTQVMQLMNAHEIDPGLQRLAASGALGEMFATRIGEPATLESVTIQIDRPDSETKRGFHVDRLTPPTYKAFVYLTDVDSPEDGAYTVVPGSHRHVVRKALNVGFNLMRERHPTDLAAFYRDVRAIPLCGPAGTLILSNQQLAHKGWSNHRGRMRYMIVCYLTPTRYWSGEPFSLGRELADSPSEP